MKRLLMIAATVVVSVLLPAAARAQRDTPLAHPADDVVLFAAESLEMPLAPGWQAMEVPYGREVRLVLLPPGVSWQPDTPDAIWICHHVISASGNESDSMRELIELNQRRLRMIAGPQGSFSEPAVTRLGDWPAVEQEFIITGAPIERRGHHLLSRTPWGVVEVHFGTPVLDYAQRRHDYQTMMQRLRLQPPRVDDRLPLEHVHDAAPILGSWKAYRSRMQLAPDGQARIIIDPTNLQAIDKSPSSQVLSGEFSARGDLLFIRWSDGSLLNYRWRLNGQELLLMDHHGQPSRLQRLLD